MRREILLKNEKYVVTARRVDNAKSELIFSIGKFNFKAFMLRSGEQCTVISSVFKLDKRDLSNPSVYFFFEEQTCKRILYDTELVNKILEEFFTPQYPESFASLPQNIGTSTELIQNQEFDVIEDISNLPDLFSQLMCISSENLYFDEVNNAPVIINEGANSIVYLARTTPDSEELLAVKINRKPELFFGLLEEANFILFCKSKYVIQIKGVNLEKKGLVMEYVKLDLHSVLFNSANSAAIEIITQWYTTPVLLFTFIKRLIKCIMHLHSLNIIHVDLKPENILVCADNRPKICDFGNSIYKNKNVGNGINRPFCTWLYAALELYQSGYPTQASDIFALGMVIRDIISFNHVPFAVNPKHMEQVLIAGQKPRWEQAEDLMLSNETFERIVGEVSACFNTEPERRPSAETLHRFFRGLRDEYRVKGRNALAPTL